MYDLKGKVYRRRDLFLTPFSAQEAVAAVKQAAVPGNAGDRGPGDFCQR